MIRWLLLIVIVAELAVGGVLLHGRLRQPTPPLANLDLTDPVTADEIRALAARCRTAEQWGELGEVYLATGFFPEAEACLRQAAALEPNHADRAFKHAFALERLGKVLLANERYEKAIHLQHPRRADCWYYVGKNHLRLEDADAALQAFRRAGDLPGARYELALLDVRAGQQIEAESQARQLAQEFPQAYHPVALRYRLALMRNDLRVAAALADQFARTPRPLPTPFDTEVDWIFGIANRVGQNRLFREAGQHMQARRLTETEASLRSALAAGWSPEIADRLGEVLFVLGRRDEAVAVLDEAVTRGRPSFELLWRLGQAHDAAGRPARAVELWERAARMATGPGARDLWQDLARRSAESGVHDKVKIFESRAHVASGIEALDAGQPGEAVRALTRAVECDPQAARAWYHLGEAQRRIGQVPDARRAYERCLRLDPDHGRARRALDLLGE